MKYDIVIIDTGVNKLLPLSGALKYSFKYNFIDEDVQKIYALIMRVNHYGKETQV